MNSLSEKIPKLAREFCARKGFVDVDLVTEAMRVGAEAAIEDAVELLKETRREIRTDRECSNLPR